MINAVAGDGTFIRVVYSKPKIRYVAIAKTYFIRFFEIGTVFGIFQILGIEAFDAIFAIYQIITRAVFSIFFLHPFYEIF